MSIEIKKRVNNFQKLLDDSGPGKRRAHEAAALFAEAAATMLAPVGKPYGGTLRQKITHNSDEEGAAIGTNLQYGVYVEMGTGIHTPGGRPTPWVYTPDNGQTFYRTFGQEPQPFIKPAVADNEAEIVEIMKENYFST